MGRTDVSYQFKKIIIQYNRIGYISNGMRQSAGLVFNPITVNIYASLFNCTPVGRMSDSVTQHVVSVVSSSLLLHSIKIIIWKDQGVPQ